MNKPAYTKDERFLLKLFEFASALGDLKEEVDCLVIGRAIGQNDKGAQVIARNLAQANFVKKGEHGGVKLTDHGLHLIVTLQGA